MRLIIALGLTCLVCYLLSGAEAAAANSPGQKYTTRYDHIDVDAILRSSRLLRSYMQCVMDRGPCTREGLELRKHLPDAIQTECTKCSVKQKEWAGKIMAHLQQFHKNDWHELLQKYDPDGSFRKKFEYEEDDEEK